MRVTVAAVAVAVVCLAGSVAAGAATGVPSGQRTLGQSVIEPVYDADHAGAVSFISTPSHAGVQPVAAAVAPLFLPVYPAGSSVGALICPHTPVDGCPDHGPVVASIAASVLPAVYGGGVIGHDHLMRLPASAGFHVELEPTLVLFTSKAAADEHLLTTAAVEAAVARGDAITLPLPPATLHGAVVSERVWDLATPVT